MVIKTQLVCGKVCRERERERERERKQKKADDAIATRSMVRIGNFSISKLSE